MSPCTPSPSPATAPASVAKPACHTPAPLLFQPAPSWPHSPWGGPEPSSAWPASSVGVGPGREGWRDRFFQAAG